jgi:hypothetical protein
MTYTFGSIGEFRKIAVCLLGLLLLLECTGRAGSQLASERLESILPTADEVSASVRTAPHQGPLPFVATGRAASADGAEARLSRVFRSGDGRYSLAVEVRTFRGTADAAALMRLLATEEGAAPGRFASSEPLGDESWTYRTEVSRLRLTARSGSEVVSAAIYPSSRAAREKYRPRPEPCVLDALIARMLLVASGLRSESGLKPRNWRLRLNGKDIDTNAVEVYGHVLVPTASFCSRAGYDVAWSRHWGMASILGQITESFVVGCADSRQMGRPHKKLRLAPFIYGDDLMVDLDDLLAVLGGSRGVETGTLAVKLDRPDSRPGAGTIIRNPEYFVSPIEAMMTPVNPDLPRLTRAELVRLLPTAQDIRGLTGPSQSATEPPLSWTTSPQSETVLPAESGSPADPRIRHNAVAAREFFSTGRRCKLRVRIYVCENYLAAQGKLERQLREMDRNFEPLRYPDALGQTVDAAYLIKGPPGESGLIFRHVGLYVELFARATDSAGVTTDLPRGLLESVAFGIYLKAGRARKFTGVMAEQNGEVFIGGEK